MSESTIQSLRADLDRVRALEADWKARGAPEPEGAGVRAKVTAAEASLANAIGDGEDPWANTRHDGPITSPSQAPSAPAAAAHVAQHADRVAHKRAARGKAPRAVSNDVINKETDARFWAQTHYKVGQKLDPKNNKADRAMTKAWLDIFHKVEAEAATGHLVTTYDHPEVVANLEQSTQAREAAEAHLDAASSTPDPWEQAQNTQAAAQANKASQAAAKAAAKYQPPTASPPVVATAARDAHAAAQKPPPNVKVFPKGHPVHWRPSAQPSNPQLAMPNAADAAGDGPTPNSASDNIAMANAANAPQHIAEHHASDEGAGDGLPQFPGKNPAKKKGLSGLQIGLIAGGGALALGGIGYAIYRSRNSSSPTASTMRIPRGALR